MADEQIRRPLLHHSSEAESEAAAAPVAAEYEDLIRKNPQCPGCRVARFRHKDAPVPTKELVLLGFVILANALPISVVYPFLYFMIEDLHVTDNQEDIGYYAGWIGSSFMIGRVLTGIVWGVIADRYGRKVVMYSGVFSVVVFNTLFGLSTNFWMALITRFCLGCFNGMLGTVKAYASEICSEEHQAVGISLVSTVWGFGLIVGPALGGFLAQPATKYPEIFRSGTLFANFPYLLQALGVLIFTIPAFFMCFYLPETLHQHHTETGDDEQQQDLVPSIDHTSIAVSGQDDDAPKPKTSTSIFRNWPFMSSTLVYCFWSLHDIAYTEIFSLWANSPKSYGGLSFTSTDVGQVLAVSGFSMLIFQITTFPLIAKRIGPILVTRIPAILTIPLLTMYPFFAKLEGAWLWAVLLPASIVKLVLGQATFTGSFMLINNSVKQNQRGAANGFSLSVVSIFKAIGPAGGGSLFAWCQTRLNAVFLPGDHLVFFFLNVFALLTAVMTLKPLLPESAGKPLIE